MSDHARFSPSSAHRWMKCAGSMLMEQPFPDTSSKYADEGTAAHFLASTCLQSKENADAWWGQQIAVMGGTCWVSPTAEQRKQYAGEMTVWEVTEDFASAVQAYLNDVRDRTGETRTLMVEQRLPLSGVLGQQNQFGTGDAVILDTKARHLTIEDLKFGMGEEVYAKDNEQMMLYALGTLELLEPAEVEVDMITMVICQPRRGHIDEHTISIDELRAFGKEAKAAAAIVVGLTPGLFAQDQNKWLLPDEHTCRWCKAAANNACPALDRAVSKEITDQFDAVTDGTALALPIQQPTAMSDEVIGRKMSFLPLLHQWAKSLLAEGNRRVLSGHKIIGSDGLPFKVVEGKIGPRKWKAEAEKEIEPLLVGQLGDKAYVPRSLITAAAAAKFLDKKTTAETWKLFTPFIEKKPGSPSVVPGSDPRPAYTGEIDADAFSEVKDPLAE